MLCSAVAVGGLRARARITEVTAKRLRVPPCLAGSLDRPPLGSHNKGSGEQTGLLWGIVGHCSAQSQLRNKPKLCNLIGTKQESCHAAYNYEIYEETEF